MDGMTQVLQLAFIMILQSSTCSGSVDQLHTKHCLAGEGVVLDGTFNIPEQQKKNIGVEWKRVDLSNNEVYVFTTTKHTKNRIGASVDGLEKGDASLHLANVTLEDEGIYTCTITTSPEVYKKTVRLEVSVEPTVELPNELTVTEGEEKTLLCKISRFYPREIDVAWFLRNTSNSKLTAISHGVCTAETELDSNRTYSVSSRITVVANAMENNGVRYICAIMHRAYPAPYHASVTLRVQAPFSITALIAGTMATSIFLVLLFLGSIFIYCRYFQSVPLRVSDIITPSLVFAKVPTELKCNITSKRPRRVKVGWFKLKPASDRNADMTWDSCSEISPLNGWQDMSEKAALHIDNTHLTSTLQVQLSIYEDNTKYRCVVNYGDKTIIRETTVQVKAYPSVLQISSLPHVPEVGKPLVLCCRVEKFYPKKIDLEWFRQGERVNDVTQFGPFPDTDREHSVWGKAEFTVEKEDNKATFTCRVYHDSFPEPGYEDITYQINTQGTPPNVMFIKCDPPQPKVGERCTLSLHLCDFSPARISVTWRRNSQQVHYGVFLSPPALNVNGLYSQWSFLQLTAAEEDHGSVFECQVEHSAQAEPERRAHTFILHR